MSLSYECTVLEIFDNISDTYITLPHYITLFGKEKLTEIRVVKVKIMLNIVVVAGSAKC